MIQNVNSFSKPEAKAAYANTSRLAFVDADRSVLPGPGPSLSRIVEFSPGNHHLFWILSRAVSPADLLRLPGTLNSESWLAVSLLSSELTLILATELPLTGLSAWRSMSAMSANGT